jgi:pimeloyl-ACP methyl ester carboxylesterase
MKRLLLRAGTVLFFALILVGLVVWRRPLSVLEALGRAGLRGAGLKAEEIAGPRGPITVYRGGQGPTLVLLHGVNDQAGAWARVVKVLAAEYRVVVPDLPGHGRSAPAEGPLPVEDLLAGVDAVLAAEPRPATLVGNSMGGWLALLTATRSPGAVKQVVLLNAAAVRAETTVSLLPRDRDEARRAMAAVLSRSAPPTPGFILDDLVRRAPRSPLTRIPADSVTRHALDGRLGEVPVPVTLIWGADDQLLPRAYAERVASGLPKSRLVFLDACGHMPQRECPDRLLPALHEALRTR